MGVIRPLWGLLGHCGEEKPTNHMLMPSTWGFKGYLGMHTCICALVCNWRIFVIVYMCEMYVCTC